MPGSPGNVRPVRDVRGRPIYQAYIGSSANPGLRDFLIAAAIVKDRLVHPEVSLDINPSTRQVLENMTNSGALGDLLRAGARLHQTGCNGCIGMGQAPATGRISLRTVPRNFPGRSGTKDDQVYLCSPETAAASVLTGEITDPRESASEVGNGLSPHPPQGKGRRRRPPGDPASVRRPRPTDARAYPLDKGPNIKALPVFPSLPDSFRAPVILKMGDDISTDEILRAGAEALPFRSNIPAISRWAYAGLMGDFPDKARTCGRSVWRPSGGGGIELRARIQPRARGLGAALPGADRRDRQELRAHRLAEPGQLRHPAPGVPGPGRLRRHRARRRHLLPRPAAAAGRGPGAGPAQRDPDGASTPWRTG